MHQQVPTGLEHRGEEKGVAQICNSKTPMKAENGVHKWQTGDACMVGKLVTLKHK